MLIIENIMTEDFNFTFVINYVKQNPLNVFKYIYCKALGHSSHTHSASNMKLIMLF